MVEIPVPPFADFATAQQFHRLLLLYLRELKRPGEPVGLHQFLLAEALWWHAPRGGSACVYCEPPRHSYICYHAGDQPGGGAVCAQCGPPFPCRTLLSVAAVARFPAPWTPVSLVRALRSAGLLQSRSDAPDKPTYLHWGGDGWTDPSFTAACDPHDGSWLMVRVERSDEETTRFADDAALCDYLLDQARASPYPYGAHVEPSWVAAVQPGAAPARSWWAQHMRLPYLDSQRPSGVP